MISFEGETLRVGFAAPFDLEKYELFLRTKRIPEASVEFDPEQESYAVTAPARFASLIGVEAPKTERPWLPLEASLFDYQRWIVKMSLEAKRFAIWADCGTGKTRMFLEWARQVHHRTGGKVLVFSPLSIIEQTREEAAVVYGGELPVLRIGSREALAQWAKAPHAPGETAIAICNPEKLIEGVMPELRYLAGMIVDESSLLKSGGGVIKWNLIKSARGIEWKLSCTATPAPNDTMEYASQASFLEKLRTEGEILWTFFARDPKTNAWKVKPHAREAFYRFMSTWSIYLRRPAAYGFRDNFADVPEPVVKTYELNATDEQSRIGRGFLNVSRGLLFTEGGKLGVTERTKLSQIAKGFLYEKGKPTRRIVSEKPGFVADLVRADREDGRQVLVWTVFDEESEILAQELRDRGIGASVLTGKTPEAERISILNAFRRGDVDVLISKASLLGYGMNFQCCSSMIFSGWNDSYEQWYQAVRRAYRYGQTRELRVHMPYIRELEGVVLDNVFRKKGQWESDAAEQEAHYARALTTAAA